MSTTFLTYPNLTGAQTTFDVTFPYLSREHVTVTVNTVPVSFTWLSANEISVVPAPVGTLTIRRRTPADKTLVTFTDGTVHSASKHNLQNRQVLFVAQEVDSVLENVLEGEGDLWFGEGRRLVNLAAPQDPNDAVTKGWAETSMTSTLAQAISNRQQAETARAGSESARDVAIAAKNDAESARDSASGHRLNAQNAANSAASSESAASGSALAAQNSADDALGSAGDAASSASAAATSASQAASSASDAATSASQASAAQGAAETARDEAVAAAASVGDPLAKDQNLADLPNPGAARGNLGLGSMATKAEGTAAAQFRNNSDNEALFVPQDRAVNTGTGLTGGGNLSANRSLALEGQALALHNFASNGLMVRTGAATYAARSLAQGNGILVTNGNGVSGNPTIAANYATQAEAQAGTNTVKVMTPQRVAQAISALAPQPTTANVLAAIAGAGAGAVGTYAFLGVSNNGHVTLFGATRAGSHLFPAGIAGAWGFTTEWMSGSFFNGQNSARAGTWRCMGVIRSRAADPGGNFPAAFGASLWLRIS